MILLDPQAHPVIGHRGNRAHAPEDTLPSFLEAVALGADAIELDLHVSKDGQLVVMHDPTLDRTTDQSGAIADRSLSELRRIDAGFRFSPDGGRTYPWRSRGATVPAFDDVLDAIPADLPLIIELKTAAAAQPLRDTVRRRGLTKRVIVAGFDDAAVAPLRGDGVAIGASTRDVVRALPAALMGGRNRQRFDALCIPPFHNGIPVPIARLVRSFRDTPVVTHVWTINDPARARRLWLHGVNGIISDDPGVILAERRARAP
jgi:glycerophosphoryl diester phosphodiesterase